MRSTSPIHVLALPSWFPTHDSPLSGVFFQEQARLLTRALPELHHLVIQLGPPREVSPRSPVASGRRVVAHVRSAPQTLMRSERHEEVRLSSLQLSERIASGGRSLDVRRVLRFLRRTKRVVDLVHAQVAFPAGGIACEIGRALRVPVIVSEHMGPFPFPGLLTADGTLRPAVRDTFHRASLVTAVSTAHREQIRHFTGRTDIDIAPNFVDEGEFFPSDTRTPRPRPRLLSVGHLVPTKGFDTLIGAVALLRDQGRAVDLQIAGEGADRQRLEQRIRELNVAEQVSLLGRVSRTALPALVRDADVLVSGSHFESFGVTLIEGMASGVPIVASDCGGPRDIVTSDTGLLVSDLQNPSAFARAIATTLDGTWSPQTIRSSFLARFSAAECARRWGDRYHETIERFHSPRP